MYSLPMLLAPLQVLLYAHIAVAAPDGQFWFGNGCFWHEMHLFTTKIEREALGRSYAEVTATAGYAGAMSALSPLCYPNAQDYNNHEELGFAEAVIVSLNGTAQYEQAAGIYFGDFLQVQADPPIWARKDVYDQGAAYRAMVGVPGGLEGEYGAILRRANVNNMTLAAGKGSDPDTFTENLVLVYDSDAFAFSTAEACLQYHDDRNDEPYSAQYGAVREARLAAGTLSENGCPANYIANTCNVSSSAVELRHVVLGTWEEAAAAEAKNAALDCLRRLPDSVPEIASFAVGPDAGLVEGNADLGLVSGFASNADLVAYEASGPHQACLTLLGPLLKERRALDYWVTTPAP